MNVPDPPEKISNFIRIFREQITPDDKRPVVVHCSAGVGRSGTFITLDRILQTMDNSDYVDIFGTVWSMRKERMSLVEIEQQYAFVHKCLLQVLQHENS